MEKEKKGTQLLWFNTWFGLVWLIMFIPCFLFFFNHRLFLQTTFSKAIVVNAEITISDDGAYMKIDTDKGIFYYRGRRFFNKVVDELRVAEYIEIWYNKENRRVVNISTNYSRFFIPIGKTATRLYLFGLILSGLMLTISIIIVVKTKGWGSYGLLEKYPKGLLETIFG